VGRSNVAAPVNDEAPNAKEGGRTEAAVRRSRWPGWIWAIPIAAALLVGWWALRSLTRGGEDITISFDNVHGIKEGGNTSIVYRGFKVGKVSGVKLAEDGGSVEVSAHVEDNVKKYLTSGTLFWLRGAKPSLSDLSSLGSVLSGPTIVMNPGPGDAQKHFVGLTREPIVAAAQDQPQEYVVALNGSVGRLEPGQPVKLRGFTVGEVKTVGFGYDAKTGAIATPVTLALYPSLFRFGGATVSDNAASLTTAIDRLIHEGLHAKLERDPPLIGDAEVTLEMQSNSSGETPATMNGVPQIPAEPGGGLDSIVARVQKVPIEQIAQNVLDTTGHIDQLVSSPKLGDAIAELDATLQQIHQTADTAGPKISKLVDSLRQTASQLDDTAKAANKTLGGTPAQGGTREAMREVTEAARSVRDLANYLDRHPEALLHGRSGE
jgi:paraquat-inducible protein B